MMKIKYLYDNRELVMALLNHWHYDEENLDLLDQFRISSNAIYPFTYKGEVQLLRFSPNKEKSPETIKAELEFLGYLKSEGYSVPDIIRSVDNNDLKVIDTDWGVYSAVVFSRLSGKRFDRIDLTDELIIDYGYALGKLHALSQKYKPKQCKRISYIDQLNWMDKILSQFPKEDLARKEVGILRTIMSHFDKTDTNYGLIHYDFELDNVFYDEASKTISVIDFDDSVYHWYVMDIVKSVENIIEEIPERNRANVQELLLKGYSSAISIDEALLKKADVFRRYVHLYAYVRGLRSISEPPHNQPEWMINLIKHVIKNMKAYSQEFGMEIE